MTSDQVNGCGGTFESVYMVIPVLTHWSGDVTDTPSLWMMEIPTPLTYGEGQINSIT